MHARVPAPPPRDTRLDVVRGWLQLTIFFSHAFGSFAGDWLVYGSWGLSDSSEQFVFLSGLVLGSVFARIAARDGVAAATRDMMRRTLRLYRTHLLVFALFGAMVVAAGAVLPGEAQGMGWGFMLRRPLPAAAAALTLLYQPAFMGILPIFIWCMLALPAFDALQRRVGEAALAAPVGLYLLVRMTGLNVPSLGPDTGIAFDPFAWQVVFMLGAWVGRRRLLRGHGLPRHDGVTVAAVLVLAVGLAARLAWAGITPWPHLDPSAWVGKEELVPPRLLHALALAWLVARFVPAEARWMHTAPFRVLAAIGRHSLQVFCVGLFLSWGVTAALRLWPGHAWIDPALIALGSAVMAGVAWRLDGALRRRRAEERRNTPPGPESSLGRPIYPHGTGATR
ncbi:OpgC family protein [Limobrevibacterium gyesilva]|uniref:OpgC domain-containing protein n=1 Tax=Limobrevibacterium gyesilva TaxID=2991712 RepID=A0AA42CEX1_9PROT|nr:OpgC domain-containing protein [Limobrevibacterium gyesilva]MCW3475819.1 OpgC domain-containing protein [Limobrevibacterium gyesilva]